MMDSAQFPIESLTSPTQAGLANTELENKVKKTTEKISENLHIVANEPSLAFYRLQEHIQKSLPQLVLKRIEINQLQRELQGKCYDLEYSVNAVKSMHCSQDTFQSIRKLILKSAQTKQQLNLNETPPKREKKKATTSMYQRFSGSFDLPSSFLPGGLSSSASVSADLKSSPQTLQPQRPLSTQRRSRASSVSSTPSHPSVSRAHSASSAPKRTVSISPSAHPRDHSVS